MALDARVVRLVEGHDGEVDSLVVDNRRAGPQDVAFATDRSGTRIILPRNSVRTLRKRVPSLEAVSAYITRVGGTVRDAHYQLFPGDFSLLASYNLSGWYRAEPKQDGSRDQRDHIQEYRVRCSPNFIPLLPETPPIGSFAIWSENLGLLVVNYRAAQSLKSLTEIATEDPTTFALPQFLYEQIRFRRPIVHATYRPNPEKVPRPIVEHILAALR